MMNKTVAVGALVAFSVAEVDAHARNKLRASNTGSTGPSSPSKCHIPPTNAWGCWPSADARGQGLTGEEKKDWEKVKQVQPTKTCFVSCRDKNGDLKNTTPDKEPMAKDMDMAGLDQILCMEDGWQKGSLDKNHGHGYNNLNTACGYNQENDLCYDLKRLADPTKMKAFVDGSSKMKAIFTDTSNEFKDAKVNTDQCKLFGADNDQFLRCPLDCTGNNNNKVVDQYVYISCGEPTPFLGHPEQILFGNYEVNGDDPKKELNLGSSASHPGTLSKWAEWDPYCDAKYRDTWRAKKCGDNKCQKTRVNQ